LTSAKTALAALSWAMAVLTSTAPGVMVTV
jgi:hypothetical protein